MKRKKCFADGGLTEDETAGLDTGYRQGAEAPAGTGEDERPAPTGMSEATKFAEPATFGAAFKAARASGAKTFEFKGKKYTTDLAGSKTSISAPAQTTVPKRDVKGADGLPAAPEKRPGIMARMREKDKGLNDKLLAGLRKQKEDAAYDSYESSKRNSASKNDAPEPKKKVLGPASEQKFLGSGYAGGGKVRGAGKASKGVRAAKCC